MIHGACVGGGLEIAASCDLRICGQSSRFGVPVNKLGLVMGYGEMQGLLQLAGRATALEIVLEGRVFAADEALAKGLVTRVVEDARVTEEAMAAACRIADGAPLVARWHKQFINRLGDAQPLRPDEVAQGYACYDTQDYRTGRAAFLNKTKPHFEGH
jgi:enoyl-CoA hydratase/carnithine racemase